MRLSGETWRTPNGGSARGWPEAKLLTPSLRARMRVYTTQPTAAAISRTTTAMAMPPPVDTILGSRYSSSCGYCGSLLCSRSSCSVSFSGEAECAASRAIDQSAKATAMRECGWDMWAEGVVFPGFGVRQADETRTRISHDDD